MIDSLVKVSFIGVEMLIGLIYFNRIDGGLVLLVALSRFMGYREVHRCF